MTEAPKPGINARGQVVRVLDGDTVDVELTIPVRIRLADCWAPETRGSEREQGRESKSELEGMLPRGARVIVQVDTGDARAVGDVLTFGRVLGRIWKQINGTQKDVSAEMVARGFATRTKDGR